MEARGLAKGNHANKTFPKHRVGAARPLRWPGREVAERDKVERLGAADYGKRDLISA